MAKHLTTASFLMISRRSSRKIRSARRRSPRPSRAICRRSQYQKKTTNVHLRRSPDSACDHPSRAATILGYRFRWNDLLIDMLTEETVARRLQTAHVADSQRPSGPLFKLALARIAKGGGLGLLRSLLVIAMPDENFSTEVLTEEVVVGHRGDRHIFRFPILANGTISLHGSQIGAKSQCQA